MAENTEEEFVQSIMNAKTEEDRRAVEGRYRTWLEQRSDESHKSFFEGKKQRRVEDTEFAEARQAARRAATLPDVVQDALINRVQDPTGPAVEKITWEQYLVMRKDPEFEPFSKYGQNLLFYTNGQPRPRPIRPLLENEVGIYRGKIVCLNSMPGESKAPAVIVQVPAQKETK